VISSKNGAIRGLEVEYDMCGQSCVSTHGFMFDERVKVRFACYTSMALHLVLLMANTNY
jgi:hypothetical protein